MYAPIRDRERLDDKSRGPGVTRLRAAHARIKVYATSKAGCPRQFLEQQRLQPGRGNQALGILRLNANNTGYPYYRGHNARLCSPASRYRKWRPFARSGNPVTADPGGYRDDGYGLRMQLFLRRSAIGSVGWLMRMGNTVGPYLLLRNE